MPSRNLVLSPSPAHWSKDFVEHLRTVHFTLIGVAIGLILIVLSAKSYNPAVALRQIHQIIELKKMWSIKWIIWRGTKKEAPASDESEDSEIDKKATLAEIVNPETDKKTINLSTIGDPAHWQRDPLLPELASESDAYALDSLGDFPIFEASTFSAKITPVGSEQSSEIPFSVEHYWAQEDTEPNWSPEVFPSTLYDFGQWWTVLQQRNYKAVFPRSLFERDGHCASVSGMGHASWLKRIANSAELDSVGLSLKVREKSMVYEGDGPGLCFFPVHRFIYVEVSQKMLADQFKNWKVGSFNSSFPDLARAGHDLEALELDDIEKFISSEAAKGSEVFEAFGMKFLAGQISLWGIVILLGVQLYFFVYLKQLSGKLDQTDAGSDVPWIGMNSSPLAQSIFFLTVFLLPCLAMAIIGMHGVSQLTRPFAWRTWPLAEAVAVTAAFIPSAVLGILTWKYRPNVKERVITEEKTSTTTDPSTTSPGPGSHLTV